jgi:hypothetical protein
VITTRRHGEYPGQSDQVAVILAEMHLADNDAARLSGDPLCYSEAAAEYLRWFVRILTEGKRQFQPVCVSVGTD